MAHTKKWEREKMGEQQGQKYKMSQKKWNAICHMAFDGPAFSEWAEAGTLQAIRTIIESDDSAITSDFIKKLEKEAADN